MINNKFAFVIPAYNAADWYNINLNSILIQSYTNWRIVYIDDCSEDNTLNLVKSFLKDAGLLSKVTFIQNQTNLGPAASRYYGYQKTDDDEICCLLDGDDWLSDNFVLEKLNSIYNSGYNATCGSYVTYADKKIINTILPINEINTKPSILYRKSDVWSCRHLRTMRSFLIKNIPLYHLQINNEWIKCCSDVAETYFIMENLKTKLYYSKEPWYVYNKDNSIRYSLSYYRKEMVQYKQGIFNYIKSL
jgi:glycosyltransferase involved in cell wall biosynthesis